MASRPRPSLLALFDPLATSSTSPSTPTRDTSSPSPSAESGSDKENLISTTPKGSCTRSYGHGYSKAHAVKYTPLGMDHKMDGGYSAQADLLGNSFALEPKDHDTSNLVLVQLADELEHACNTTQDTIDRGEGQRETLSEISLSQNNNNNRTPQSVARDKRLNKFGAPTVTPKSERKFAAGISGYAPTTPPVSSPLASSRAAWTPRSLLSPKIDSSSVTHHVPPSTAPRNIEYPAPSLPFSSQSSLLSSTPASDPSPTFQDPPSGLHGASFEIQNSLCMKRMDLSGDLLNDDMSFLARLEQASFDDVVRGNGPDRTARSSPATRQDTDVNKVPPEKLDLSQGTGVSTIGEIQNGIKAKTPSRSSSTVFRRSASHSGLTFNAESSENVASPASPIDIQPRTPSSSPFSGNNNHKQALAPKKSQAVLRGSKTLSRSCSSGISEHVEEGVNIELGAPVHTKMGSVRARPSTEIKPLARSQSFMVKQADAAIPPHVSVRRSSVSRPSIGRRTSVGHGLSPAKPTISQSQEQSQKQPQASLTTYARRPSVSASTKATPVKANNFATAGRLGGARRVPLTSNAPLFKPIETTISEVQSPKPNARLAAIRKTGPQRPSASAILGRSVSGPGLNSLDRAPFGSSTRTLGRVASASSVVFSRSSFMTSSGSTSRLPIPPTKSTSKIPGPGARKAF